MVTYGEALKVLEKQENGAELMEAVKSELSKKNNEAKNLRDTKKEVEDKLVSVFKSFGLEGDATVDDLTAALEAKVEESTKNPDNPEVKKLSMQIKTLNKQMEQWKSQAEEEKTKRIREVKTKRITDVLESGNAINPRTLAKALFTQVKVNDDETLTYLDDDGQEYELKEGITQFLQTNPDLVKSNQTPGSGSQGSGSHVFNVTRDQLEDPSFYREHQEKILKGDYNIIE